MRGRKPKPNSLKLVQGSRRVNDSEPQLPSEIPSCPALLKNEGKKEWSRITVELHRVGLLTVIDRAALTVYCQIWGRWVQSENRLKAEGTVIQSPSGYPMLNPHLSVINRCLDQMHRYLVEFGMSPSSRSRIKVQPEPQLDELERYLRKDG